MTFRSKPIVTVYESGGPRGPQDSVYLIETTGVTRDEILEQLREFARHAKANPNVLFLLTPIGRDAGYTLEVIAQLFDDVIFTKNVFIPANVMYQIEDNQFGGNIDLAEMAQYSRQLGLWEEKP
jgi:hypothetical protein